MAVNKIEKTATTATLNLPVNVIGALCYIPWVGWVVGIVVLLLEKNTDLRWHAVHGLVLGVLLTGLTMALAMTIILAPLSGLVWVGGIIVQIYAAVKAYGGEKPRFFKVSEWTDMIMKKIA